MDSFLFVNSLINIDYCPDLVMFLLSRRIFHYRFQRSFPNRQCTITSLPFKLIIASIHVIDRIRACAFQVTNTVCNRNFGWDGYNNMSMVFHIPRSMDFQTQFISFSIEHAIKHLLKVGCENGLTIHC